MRWRSPQEIAFRLRQEASNLRLLLLPPALPNAEIPSPLRSLPDLDEDAGIEAIADEVLAHRIPIFGQTIDTGREIAWRRDYINNIESDPRYFRRVPYLNFTQVGDHKFIWELNRHQHWVVLARAFRLTGRREYLAELVRQFDSWMAANPFLHGINWASALEVAFRALSWIWVYHLVGADLSAEIRRRLLRALYLHGCHLESNLSVYFSPNTHLLGEAIALHALGILFPQWPRSQRWTETGARITLEEMDRQVREDGSHFEQSTYYHVYALDMFQFHQSIAETTPTYRDKLGRMRVYLAALLGPAGSLPFIGDDDGGRLFHPYGRRDQFGRASLRGPGPGLSTTAEVASKLFPNAGFAVMIHDDIQLVAKAGPFGPWGSGHSHADVLSFTLRKGDQELLLDPGTFDYISDPLWRNRFRGTAFHNTIRINQADQATPVNPFRWSNQPRVSILEWRTSDREDFLDAHCRYNGFTHRRRILFLKSEALVLVLDTVEGPPGEHLIEQFWHPAGAVLTSHPAQRETAWRSEVYGSKTKTDILRVAVKTALPVTLAAAIPIHGDYNHLEYEAPNTISLAGQGRALRRALSSPHHGDL